MPRQNKDTDHPFWRPLWRRLATISIAAAWFSVEIVGHDGMFTVISGAFLAYGIWVLLIAYDAEAAQTRAIKEQKEADNSRRRTDGARQISR